MLNPKKRPYPCFFVSFSALPFLDVGSRCRRPMAVTTNDVIKPSPASVLCRGSPSEDEVRTRWGLWSMMKLVTQIMTWFTYVPCSTCEQCGKHQVHLFFSGEVNLTLINN
ncbi:hypothetical protein HanIR_Chr00c15g0908821 [Helianthus annuus]|nr:hypothetical protein HanIR_Chr00c15g0908821 [Helianthus annuus]